MKSMDDNSIQILLLKIHIRNFKEKEFNLKFEKIMLKGEIEL